MPLWINILVTSAVVMGLSYTIATQKVCAPLREKLGGKDTWFGYLLSCPYCLSHWLSFAIVPLTGAYGVHVRVQWGVASAVLDWFFSCILVTVIAAFLRVAFYAIDESQGLVRRQQREVEAETLVQRKVAEKLVRDEPPRAH